MTLFNDFIFAEKVYTKEQAVFILRDQNKQNRKKRTAKIKQFKDKMNAGRWLKNHVCIAFTEAGELVDGQNRLTAFVESDLEKIAFVTCLNAIPNSMGSIDQGANRNPSDHLCINGVPNADKLPQAILAVIGFEQLPNGLWSHLDPLDNDEYLDAYNRHAELFQISYHKTKTLHQQWSLCETTKKGKVKKVSLLSRANYQTFYILASLMNQHEDDILCFLNNLAEGSGDSSAIRSYRKWHQDNYKVIGAERTRRQININNMLLTYVRWINDIPFSGKFKCSALEGTKDLLEGQQ